MTKKKGPDRLTDKGVQAETEIGYHSDHENNLYLQVRKSKSKKSKLGVTKSWIFRYALNGKKNMMGLGPYPAVPLATQPHPFKPGEFILGARALAKDACALLLLKLDPIEARDAPALSKKTAHTFAYCAETYIAAHKAGWKSEKHTEQWEKTIDTYCASIADVPVASITDEHVLAVLEPIWSRVPETASRLRGRLERILDWARVKKYRAGENPARWTGHLEFLLPDPTKLKPEKHHAALHFEKVAEFMRALAKETGTAARCLEFTILTGARTGESIGALPEEFDLAKGMWIVPASRMKMQKEHRVAMGPRAVEIVKEQLKAGGDFIFAGRNRHRPLSNMAMLEVIRRTGWKKEGVTTHGFRSALSDWRAEVTEHSSEVLEMALAHAVSNKVEAAYRRMDMVEKRRQLLIDWEQYCLAPALPDNVTSIKAGAKKKRA